MFLRITSLIVFSFGLLNVCGQATDAAFSNQRTIIIMFDGLGMSYYNNSAMPHLKQMAARGFFKEVNDIMPSVTNANNASICTGTFPDVNGIIGNSFINASGREDYMEDSNLVLAPTIFQKYRMHHMASALVSSKKKSISLLSRGADIALSPETADSEWVKRLGTPPSIYSAEINYWTMRAAIYILKNRPNIRCVYIHSTDFPMHTWSPSDSNSLKHLSMMDQYIYQLQLTAPDARILITADHDVNHKSLCIDIEKTLAGKGIAIRAAISAEKDKYVQHHRGFGGASYIYLQNKTDSAKVRVALHSIKGVQTVLSNREASADYHLMGDRIGDFVCLGDSLTVFGTLENHSRESLPDNYRSHGSAYESRVPLIIYNAEKKPSADYFHYNMDIARWIFTEN